MNICHPNEETEYVLLINIIYIKNISDDKVKF